MSKKEREARLNKVIEEFKAWQRGEEEPPENTFEDLTQTAMRAWEMMEAERRANAWRGKAVFCPNCGELKAYRVRRKRSVVSEAEGKASERRYQCRGCKHEFYLSK